MGDSSTSNATGPQTPPLGTNIPVFVSELKSTPSATGTAVVSEYIDGLGVECTFQFAVGAPTDSEHSVSAMSVHGSHETSTTTGNARSTPC